MNRKELEKFISLCNNVFFKLDRVPVAKSHLFYLKDVCKLLEIKEPFETLPKIGLCVDSSLLCNNTKLAKKAHRYNTLGCPISNGFECVIDESDVFRLIFLSKTKKALEIKREFFNLIPLIINDFSKKELQASFGHLGVFLFDIKKVKKNI